MAELFPSQDRAKDAVRVWSLIQSIKVGMLSDSLTAPGRADLQVRPMRGRFEEHADAIWFIVSRKEVPSADDMSKECLLTFSSGADGDHVALTGTLSASSDRSKLKGLWDAHAGVEFPAGAEDPDATLLKFSPRQAKFWTEGGLIGFIIDFIEAKFTGEARKIGEHGAVMA